MGILEASGNLRAISGFDSKYKLLQPASRKLFRFLYDFREPYFTEDNIEQLSGSVEKNYEDKNRWFAKAFERAGFDVMLVDESWDQFKTDADFPSCILVI